ncbi:MAG: hypothetical protein HKN15_09020 [Xanthomonadales bacterium]|nr:hypothetical protein [Xanthomonadales bacterium]
MSTPRYTGHQKGDEDGRRDRGKYPCSASRSRTALLDFVVVCHRFRSPSV